MMFSRYIFTILLLKATLTGVYTKSIDRQENISEDEWSKVQLIADYMEEMKVKCNMLLITSQRDAQIIPSIIPPNNNLLTFSFITFNSVNEELMKRMKRVHMKDNIATPYIIIQPENKTVEDVIELMKEINDDKQMKDVWMMTAPGKAEKTYDKHPTQKPLSLLDRLILAATDEGDLVLDAFNGSGTTGVSCIRTNREYIGIELEKEFIQLSEKRFSEQTKLNDKLSA